MQNRRRWSPGLSEHPVKRPTQEHDLDVLLPFRPYAADDTAGAGPNSAGMWFGVYS